MAKFLQNEKVLAFHGPLIYEAKIQKVAESETSTKYLIHYQFKVMIAVPSRRLVESYTNNRI